MLIFSKLSLEKKIAFIEILTDSLYCRSGVLRLMSGQFSGILITFLLLSLTFYKKEKSKLYAA